MLPLKTYANVPALDSVVLESTDLNLKAASAYLPLLLSSFGVEQSVLDTSNSAAAPVPAASSSSPRSSVTVANAFSTLRDDPGTPSEADSADIATPPFKRSRIGVPDELKVLRALESLDSELEARKETLLGRRKKAESKAQETYDNKVKAADKKLNTSVVNAESENEKRLKSLEKELIKYQTDFDSLDSQLHELQGQHEIAKTKLSEQQSRVETSNTTKATQLELARSTQLTAVEAAQSKQSTDMESAAQSYEQNVASAIKTNDAKRDKLLKSLTNQDRDKILAEEQERAANVARMNPHGLDAEAALAMALEASTASLQSTSETEASVADAFEKVYPDEGDSEISSDLLVISVQTETVAQSCSRYPIESEMGAEAFPAEVAGKVDEAGIVEYKFEPGKNSLVVTLSGKPMIRVTPDPTCAGKGAPCAYEFIDDEGTLVTTEQQKQRGINLCYAFSKVVHEDKARAASAQINEKRKRPNNNLKLTSHIEMRHFVRGLIGAIRVVSQMTPVDPEITKVCPKNALGEKAQRLLENFPVYFDTCANVHFAPSLVVRELELFIDSLNATRVRGISTQPLVTDGQAHNIPIFAVTEDLGLFRCHVTAQVADLSKFVLSAIKLIESGDAIGILALDPETKKFGSFLQFPGGAVVALSKTRSGMLILGKNDKHCQGGCKSEPVPIHRLVKELLRRDKLRQQSLQNKGEIPTPRDDLQSLFAMQEPVEGTTAADVARSAEYYEALVAVMNKTAEEEKEVSDDTCPNLEAMLATDDADILEKEVSAEDLEQRRTLLLEQAAKQRREYQRSLQRLKIIETRQDIGNSKSNKVATHTATTWHNTLHKSNDQMLIAARDSNILMECADGGKPRQGSDIRLKDVSNRSTCHECAETKMTAPAVKQVHVSEAKSDSVESDFTKALMEQNQVLLSQNAEMMSKFQMLMDKTHTLPSQDQSLQAAQPTAAHSSE